MTMAGGATLGYCATGSRVIAAPPMTRMKSAMTHAKMGRSMKKREFIQGVLLQRLAAVAEGAAEAAAEAAPAGPLAGDQGTGATGALGRIFWKPSTTTCSPALRPPSTTHWLP